MNQQELETPATLTILERWEVQLDNLQSSERIAVDAIEWLYRRLRSTVLKVHSA